MNIIKPLTLVFFLFITGCATVGPTIIIETNEHAEDFVVLCKKDKSYLFKIGHTASRYSEVDHVIVTESGKEVDCGFMLGGTNGHVSIIHPTLIGDRTQNYEKDGVKHFIYNRTKLDLLDEQKAKFEAGYWDKLPNPGFEYANNVGNCGLSFSYLDEYSQAKHVDKEHFRKLYNDSIVQCLTRVYKIYKKYRPKSSKQYTDGETRMNKFWSSEKWKQYE